MFFTYTVVVYVVSVPFGESPMVTLSLTQFAGILSDFVSTSTPLERFRKMISPFSPTTSNLIVATVPDPLTPVTPGTLKSSLIEFAPMK